MSATPPLPDLRTLLARAIQKARRVGETGARQALQSFAVDRAKPFGSMSLVDRSLRNRLRMRGQQAGDPPDRQTGAQQIGHLAHEVAYEHWHRMLFARFLTENGLLRDPEDGVDLSLDDCRNLAEDAGTDPWEFAGRCAGHMLPEIFRSDDPVLELPLPPETRQELEGLLDGLPEAVFPGLRLAPLDLPVLAGRAEGAGQQERREDRRGRVACGHPALHRALHGPLPAAQHHRRVAARASCWQVVQIWPRVPRTRRQLRQPRAPRHRRRLRLLGTCASCAACARMTRGTRELAPGVPPPDRSPTGPATRRNSACSTPAAAAVTSWPRRSSCSCACAWPRRAWGPKKRSVWCSTNNPVRPGDRPPLHPDRRVQPGARGVASGGRGHRPPAAQRRVRRTRTERIGGRVAGARGAGRGCDRTGRGPRPLRGETDAVDRCAAGGNVPVAQAVQTSTRAGVAAGPGIPGRRTCSEPTTSLWPSCLPWRSGGRGGSAGRDERGRGGCGDGPCGGDHAEPLHAGRHQRAVSGRGANRRQELRTFAATHHGDAKGDLATVFVSRIFGWLGEGGTQAVVSPQNWLFLKTYRKLRERLLKGRTWNMVWRGWVRACVRKTVSGRWWSMSQPRTSSQLGVRDPGWQMAGVDVSSPRGQRPIKAAEKGEAAAGGGAGGDVAAGGTGEEPGCAQFSWNPFGDSSAAWLTIADYGKGSTTGDQSSLSSRLSGSSRRMPHRRTPCKVARFPGRRSALDFWTGRAQMLKVSVGFSHRTDSQCGGCRLPRPQRPFRAGWRRRQEDRRTPDAVVALWRRSL